LRQLTFAECLGKLLKLTPVLIGVLSLLFWFGKALGIFSISQTPNKNIFRLYRTDTMNSELKSQDASLRRYDSQPEQLPI
jgi:hypothetical protein